jgi:hypothetical protein
MNEEQRYAEEKDNVEGTHYWKAFLKKLGEERAKQVEYCATQVVTLASIGKVGYAQGLAAGYRKVLDIWEKILQDSKKERK